eukprot:CAMPEP_0119501416 /NCGR_PEP_ID=MMETSP1344-20130328/23253_1 /TAXON_ID=236787 /ORGANISM="Florenciella parvula, Strain CCMP2471" /LENGTH=142 /DNA_ID=CAMNT_0007537573 /DNA_START=115 /DNA_END=540 /DNA_ORIENTATION=-
MSVARVKNPIQSLRDKIKESKEARRRVDSEIDALTHEKAAIVEVLNIMVTKLHGCRDSIAEHSEEQETYTEAIEEFEEMYGPILGIEPKKVEVPEIVVEDEEEIAEMYGINPADPQYEQKVAYYQHERMQQLQLEQQQQMQQ